MAKIYVDADACPVKNEACAIAKRLNGPPAFPPELDKLANAAIRTP